MDLNGVERIDVHGLGGADNITINDLTGTGVAVVVVDLAGTPGITDGQLDTVTTGGTAGNDTIRLSTVTLANEFNGGVLITGVAGLGSGIVVDHQDATDQLVVNGGAGNDTIDASAVVAGAMALTINGGDGDDVITGSQSNDLVNGGRGNDTAFLGAGDDTFVWNPGDGSDTVEGQAGFDTLLFNDANVNENVTISANGQRARLTRDVGIVTMDLNGVERIDVHALGGADNIAVNDLSGTGTAVVVVDLAGANGAADGQLDTVTTSGTAGNDTIRLSTVTLANEFNGGVLLTGVAGLSSGIVVDHQDATDQLVVNGGAGNDTIDASAVAAGAMALTLNGGAGNDTIIGSQGNDLVDAGDGRRPAGRNDTALLGAGDDTFVWNPGDGSDIVEGQAGFDTLVFNGSNQNENIDISANGSRVRLSRDVGNVTMDLNGVERIDVHGLGGADNITINDLTGTGVAVVVVDLAGTPGITDGQLDTVTTGGTAGNDTIRLSTVTLANEFNGGVLITGVAGLGSGIVVDHQDATDQLVVNGGAGNDTIDASAVVAGAMALTINGGDGDDVITGSQSNDLVNGGRGNDTAFLGAGDDTFVWNPGDGSDTVEGQAGFDTLLFNDANVNENVTISANGQRARLTRDVGIVTMDLNGVERIDVHALGGVDNIAVNDLSGTGTAVVVVDLAGANGAADGQLDTVTTSGTAGNDTIRLSTVTLANEFNGGVLLTGVAGLSSGIVVDHQDATDQLVVNGGAGNDTIDASAVVAGAMALTLNGGAGNDTIIGSQGSDLVDAGDGNDTVTGGVGNDTALLGTGDDTFVWNPGDGSDIVEGQAGFDTLVFNGSNQNENIDISANGSRVRLSRDVGNVTMDLNGVERIDVHGLGGADNITINDLTGTGVAAVVVDLAGTSGVADGQLDTVTTSGTAGNDAIKVRSFGGGVLMTGDIGSTTTGILVVNQDATDQLVINGGAGNDAIEASEVLAGAMALTINGGDGVDVITGSQGNDLVNGGRGDDQAFLSGGNDTFVWNPGDGSDTVDGQGGTDTLVFNGANINERIDISANGQRGRFTRDVASITMDLNNLEHIQFTALGGADTITVNDLSGTAVTQVALDLSGVAGTGQGDGAADTVIVDGTAGDDHITVATSGSQVLVNGLPAQVTINGFEAANDTLVINGGAGNDTVVFNGSNQNENIDLSANGNQVRLSGNVTMDLNGVERIDVHGLGGADNITINDLSGTGVAAVVVDLAGTSGVADGQLDTVTTSGTAGNDAIKVTSFGGGVLMTGDIGSTTTGILIVNQDATDRLVINGGAGNDAIEASGVLAGAMALTINGGDGVDVITGSQGNDLVNGGRGDDQAFLSGGNDTFVWNPGDGSDTVDGQGGTDTLVFNGANINERIDISANGQRGRFTRDVASITMDLNNLEHIQFTALGGADTITVNDLSGTAVTQVALDLSGVAGTGQGDGAADSVIVNGTAGNDHISIVSSGAQVLVNGLPAQVTITGAEAANDQLVINGGAGNDIIDASALNAGQIGLVINAGDGNDTITGSQGNDVINGGTGNDVALLGAGNDTFVWNPGDGSDTVDGQAGADTLQFNGANVAESITISANGGHATLSRDIGTVTMDLDNVETINVGALGGADTITVNDLTGTDVSGVNIDLAGSTPGAGDGQADTIVINGTNGADAITVTNTNGVVTITGLASTVTITNFEANDRIVINGLGGDDVIQAAGLTGMQLTANGGDGNDVLIGSPGDDVLTGGAGDDILNGGPGIDVLDGGPGNNVLIQSAVAAPPACPPSPGGRGARGRGLGRSRQQIVAGAVVDPPNGQPWHRSDDASAPTAGGVLRAAGAALLGQFMASSFVTTSDDQHATPIADLQSSPQPLLTLPHFA